MEIYSNLGVFSKNDSVAKALRALPKKENLHRTVQSRQGTRNTSIMDYVCHQRKKVRPTRETHVPGRHLQRKNLERICRNCNAASTMVIYLRTARLFWVCVAVTELVFTKAFKSKGYHRYRTMKHEGVIHLRHKNERILKGICLFYGACFLIKQAKVVRVNVLFASVIANRFANKSANPSLLYAPVWTQFSFNRQNRRANEKKRGSAKKPTMGSGQFSLSLAYTKLHSVSPFWWPGLPSGLTEWVGGATMKQRTDVLQQSGTTA